MSYISWIARFRENLKWSNKRGVQKTDITPVGPILFYQLRTIPNLIPYFWRPKYTHFTHFIDVIDRIIMIILHQEGRKSYAIRSHTGPNSYLRESIKCQYVRPSLACKSKSNHEPPRIAAERTNQTTILKGNPKLLHRHPTSPKDPISSHITS